MVCACSGCSSAANVERVDRPEPGVAGAGVVAADLFQVGENVPIRRVQIVEVQLKRLVPVWSGRSGVGAGRCRVGGDGVRAGVALGDQVR